jgi:hypothetical protein
MTFTVIIAADTGMAHLAGARGDAVAILSEC